MLNRHPSAYCHKAAGFSLVELMLAMLIGLIITAGVFSLYVSTRDTQRASDEQLQMVTNARFAIDTIAYDLRHAGLWGGTSIQTNIACTKNTACTYGDDMPPATGDCEALDYVNFDRPVFGANDSNPYSSTCASNGYRAGTDILQVRYADSAFVVTPQLASNTAYVRSNFEGGKVFVYNGGLPNHDGYKWPSNASNDQVTKNYPLVSHVYYVSNNTDGADGIPSLRRASLVSGPQMDDEVIISGVEDLQVQYGIVDDEANPDDQKTVVSYVNANRIGSDLDWQKVTAVKVYLLMRSLRPDRDGIVSGRTFSYAGKTADETDGFRRFLLSSVIHLRNTERLGEMSSPGS